MQNWPKWLVPGGPWPGSWMDMVGDVIVMLAHLTMLNILLVKAWKPASRKPTSKRGRSRGGANAGNANKKK
ncbi:hypothetical protein DXG01_001731, partial [Tephrocybe rancida]